MCALGADCERSLKYSSKEGTITIRRIAKLYALLGERAYACFSSSTAHINYNNRYGSSDAQNSTTGNDNRVGDMGIEPAEMDTVQKIRPRGFNHKDVFIVFLAEK